MNVMTRVIRLIDMKELTDFSYSHTDQVLDNFQYIPSVKKKSK